MTTAAFPPLYAILDPEFTSAAILDLAAELASAGVTLIQFRDKRSPSSQIIKTARELNTSLVTKKVRFMLNDRPDIAAILRCGVHVGQEDLPPDDARKIVGPNLWVGVSTHNLDQLRQADRTSADYIAIGPVFPTSTKQNPDPVVGLDFIRAARAITRKPLVAIGGITLEKSASVFEAGADSIAIIRDLGTAENPAERAKEFLAVAGKSRAKGF